MATTNFTVRMENELKSQAEELFAELGLNLTTAINVFLRQSLRAGGFPFKVKLDAPEKDGGKKEKAGKKGRKGKGASGKKASRMQEGDAGNSARPQESSDL